MRPDQVRQSPTINNHRNRPDAFNGPPLQLSHLLASQRNSGFVHEARMGECYTPERKYVNAGSASPVRLKYRYNDYGSMGVIVSQKSKLTKSTIDPGIFVGRSTGTLRYPNRGAQTERGPGVKDQKKSYINYADTTSDSEAELENTVQPTGPFGFLNRNKPQNNEDKGSVKQLHKRTIQTLEEMNKMIVELKSKGGDGKGQKRPPLPECF